MAKRLAKADFSKYVTPFDLKHAENLLDGLIQISSADYTVVSVIRILQWEDVSSVYDEKHLVIRKEDGVLAVWEGSDDPDYLNYEAFVKMFAKRLKFDFAFETIVAVNTFDHDPNLTVAENLAQPQESRHSWYVDDFMSVPRIFAPAMAIMPPRFAVLPDPIVAFDGTEIPGAEVLMDFNTEDDDVLGTLTANFNDSGERVEPDSLSWFIAEAGDGIHNVIASWDGFEGEPEGGNVLVRTEGDVYSVFASNRMVGALDYSLFVEAVNTRVDRGVPTSIVVQTFKLEDAEGQDWLGDTPYEIRGWHIDEGYINALTKDGVKDAVHFADEGDHELKHATFVKANSLDLSSLV